MCSGGSAGERQMAAGSGNVGRGWNAGLVPVPLAESGLGTRRHAERRPAGLRPLPRACAQAAFPAVGSALPICIG